LFKYLNPETYNQLKCSFGVYIIVIFTFLVFRVAYYILLQFDILTFVNYGVDIIQFLKTIYYFSVIIFIAIISYFGHRSIKENKEYSEEKTLKDLEEQILLSKEQDVSFNSKEDESMENFSQKAI